MKIISIDPGTEVSAFVQVDFEKGVIINKGIEDNTVLLNGLDTIPDDYMLSIEMVASYGMPVGKDVFETVVWIGRFYQNAIQYNINPLRLYRKDIKMHLCKTTRAKDSNIRQALIDKYGKPGTKKDPNPFYNDSEVKMKKDIWAALAIADYTYSVLTNQSL